MSQNVAPALTSFNAGELSPYLDGRVDMAKYQNGCRELKNFRPIPQGPAVRRSGTRYVGGTRNMAHRSWLVRFIFSEDDSYVLEFGDHYVRFYTDNGVLNLAGPPVPWSNVFNYVRGDTASLAGVNYYCITPHVNQMPPNPTYWMVMTGPNLYEAWSPYSISDLTNPTDGTFMLDYVQTGDVIFFAHPNHPPNKLSRVGPTSWVFSPARLQNGPFEDVDPDNLVTVYASAVTGVGITLTASAAIFTPDMIGSLFLLEQKKVDGYPVWEPGKAVGAGVEWRSDSNVYRSVGAGTTGTVKPTHREGAKFDGSGVGAGVQWEYIHSGYGIVVITGTAGNTATGDVVSEIPSQATGAPNASTKWAKAAWRATPGFPSLVTIFRERLTFLRGQELWGSVAGDFENFAARDGAETLPDSAFHITIGSSETNAGVWMVPKDALLVGTRGAEFSVGQVTESEVFGPGNIKASQESAYGARQVPPATVGDSVLFVQRSGERVRDIRFSFSTNSYEASDLMVLSGHVALGQIIQCAFALEPHSEMWACCNNGDLIALTYQLEQDVLGWHPHRIGGGSGEQGMVESLVVIPSPDGTYDQVWLQVFRVIDGAPTRYIEYMERDWSAARGMLLEDAVFSDSAATFNGMAPGATATITGGVTWSPGEAGAVTVTGLVLVVGDEGDQLVLTASVGNEARVRIDTVTSPTTASVTFVSAIPPSLQGIAAPNVSFARDVISGLDYLEGEEVTLIAEGAAHPRRTVTGGSITLQQPAHKVQVGLPADAILETMRIEGGAANGTSQGKIKRIHQVTYRLYETLGGASGPAGEEQVFDYRADYMAMDQPPDFLTGDLTQMYTEGYSKAGRVRILCDQPLPFTLIALYPQLKVEERM